MHYRNIKNKIKQDEGLLEQIVSNYFSLNISFQVMIYTLKDFDARITT